MAKTVAFLHTSGVLIPMFKSIAEKELVGAEQFHMVDESLIKNTIRAGELTRETTRRLIGMVSLAREGGADAVLVTCSSIGAAATAAAGLHDFPVVRMDDAMAEEAVLHGKRIGVAATSSTTLAPTVALLRRKAAVAGREIEIVESLCSKAFEAVLAGDGETHDRLLSAELISLIQKAARASALRENMPRGQFRIVRLQSVIENNARRVRPRPRATTQPGHIHACDRQRCLSREMQAKIAFPHRRTGMNAHRRMTVDAIHLPIGCRRK